MTTINKENIIVDDLWYNRDKLLRAAGVFLGIPMIEDPELPQIWNPLNNAEHMAALKDLMGIATSIDTFGTYYKIYQKYRDANNLIFLAIRCPYDVDRGPGNRGTYSPEILNRNRALGYMQIIVYFLTLNPETRFNILEQDLFKLKKDLKIF